MNNEERDSQLSAMFDGELPDEECELLARRIARDEQLKRQWSRYALIGAVIREEPLRVRRSAAGTVVGSGVAASVARELDRDGTIAADGSTARAGRALDRWGRPVAGLGIAAGVAALAVFWLQGRAVGVADPTPPALAATTATSAVEPALLAGAANVEIVIAPPSVVGQAAGGATRGSAPEPRSYVVPPAPRQAVVGPSAQLANYVVAHSEFSGPIARRSVLSGLIAAEGEPPAPAARTDPAAREAGAQSPTASAGR
jgi:negative regulator of sigma E activity